MKLLVDAQCIQSTSSLRGIGRYALSLTRALAQRPEHQVEVLLNNGDDPSRLLRARSALETFLPPRCIHVFDAPWPWLPPYDSSRRPAAEAAYTAAVRSIGPDALLVASPFEGDLENVMTVRPSPGDPPSAAILYDLIPALDPGTYLLGPGADIYWRRLTALRRFDALLSISSYSGDQAHEVLAQDCPPVTPIWGGPYPSGDFPAFEPQQDDVADLAIPDDFVLSVGGDHPRKNLDRLVAAWGRVPAAVRAGRPLVIACRLNRGTVRRLRRISNRSGLGADDLLLTGGVSERTLHNLYAKQNPFVFASVEEGLGMPPLEAMAAGCPTLMAKGSSLSELSEDAACFFDGLDVADMASAITRLLGDDGLSGQLRDTAAVSAKRFTWARSADLAWQALATLSPATPRPPTSYGPVVALSDRAGLERLALAPAPVLLDSSLPDGELGELGLPVAPRAALAPAIALLSPDFARAREAISTGALNQPVLHDPSALARVAQHDFYAAFRDRLDELPRPDPDLTNRIVRAVARSPRWTLERPRPVWLLVDEHAFEGLPCVADEAGLDLVTAPLEGVAVAALVDVVLIPLAQMTRVEPSLSDARRRGAVVVALLGPDDPDEAPAWCEVLRLPGALTAEIWTSHVAPRSVSWGRTTGWPWRDVG